MKPILKSVDLINSWGDDFDSQFRFHLNKGWVYSGEDCFVMATVENLCELNLNKGLTGKAWFIYVYVGSLRRVLDLIPFRLEHVAFRRNNGPIKVYEMETLLRKLEVT